MKVFSYWSPLLRSILISMALKKLKKNTLKELLRMPFVDSGANTDYFALGWMQLIEARVLNYGSCVINSLPLV